MIRIAATRIAALSAAALIAATAAASAQAMTMDRPVTLPSGITAVCTGIGEAKDDPRWKAYPIRVEFSNDAQQYLAGAHVSLKNSDNVQLADFDCSGAWVLLQLPGGKYDVTASLLYRKQAPVASAAFAPPKTGQKRVVLIYKGVNANE